MSQYSNSDAVAVIHVVGGSVHEVSFRQLQSDILTLQNVIFELASTGFEPGDIVFVSTKDVYLLGVAFLTLMSMRLICVPLDPRLPEVAFKSYVDRLPPRLVIVTKDETDDDHRRTADVCLQEDLPVLWCGSVHDGIKAYHFRPAQEARKKSEPQSRGQEIALILFTSGTTGRPKTVALSHDNILHSSQSIIRTYDLTHEDCSILVMPLFHVHGLMAGFLAPLYAGGKVVLGEDVGVQTFWDLARCHSCSWYTAVPTIHQRLLNQLGRQFGVWTPAFRFVRSCSAPLSLKLKQDLETAYQAVVLEAYGMTEATHQIASFSYATREQRVPGSVGVGQGTEISVRGTNGEEIPTGDEGEICIRGSGVIRGYHEDDQAKRSAFWKDGWFRSGDLGRISSSGLLSITGRLKEIINRGGEKISPLMIDRVIAQIAGVESSCTFAVTNCQDLGEGVGTALILTSGSDLTESDFRHDLRKTLPYSQIPTEVWIVQDLPRNATGKISRLTVAESVSNVKPTWSARSVASVETTVHKPGARDKYSARHLKAGTVVSPFQPKTSLDGEMTS